MKRIVAAAVLIASSAFAADPYIPTDAERARWTMQDMRSWKIVFDAYRMDHKQYPVVNSLEEARAIGEPVYIKRAPMNDAWGRPYRIESNASAFRIVSSGADGLFQADPSMPGELKSFDDDAVASNEGKWLYRHWEMK
jgi:hypothetical protein